MARQSARKTEYRGGQVYGNLAYDERRLERYAPQEREERREVRETAPERVEVRRPARKPRVRERQKVSVGMLLGAVALCAMVVVVLMSYARLTEISADVVEMQSKLATLQDEHVMLLAAYEQTFDLETIKEAAAAAGMYKPSASQIIYLDLSAPDSVVLYEQANTNVLSKIFTSLGQGVCAVVEYFQ